MVLLRRLAYLKCVLLSGVGLTALYMASRDFGRSQAQDAGRWQRFSAVLASRSCVGSPRTKLLSTGWQSLRQLLGRNCTVSDTCSITTKRDGSLPGRECSGWNMAVSVLERRRNLDSSSCSVRGSSSWAGWCGLCTPCSGSAIYGFSRTQFVEAV